jgi:hypothetical protein
MAITVEDGTGLPDANSYASEDTADNYCDDRALTDWTENNIGDKEAALIRASAGIDARFRARYPGVRVNGRSQGLEWPRTTGTSLTSNVFSQVTDAEGNPIAIDEIPIEVINATIELAIRELVTPGASAPDRERSVREVKAGEVSVTFASNAAETTQFDIIDDIMATLVGVGGSSSLIGEASRG